MLVISVSKHNMFFVYVGKNAIDFSFKTVLENRDVYVESTVKLRLLNVKYANVLHKVVSHKGAEVLKQAIKVT